MPAGTSDFLSLTNSHTISGSYPHSADPSPLRPAPLGERSPFHTYSAAFPTKKCPPPSRQTGVSRSQKPFRFHSYNYKFHSRCTRCTLPLTTADYLHPVPLLTTKPPGNRLVRAVVHPAHTLTRGRRLLAPVRRAAAQVAAASGCTCPHAARYAGPSLRLRDPRCHPPRVGAEPDRDAAGHVRGRGYAPAPVTQISFALPAGAFLSVLKIDQLSGETYKP
ncbi:hypothetical protein EDB89DRAFT_389597 [Lactarius sanguifluus]|nr:hypothetical protein EDB89DRAFT_389597 [Lactarius sanguifluus]